MHNTRLWNRFASQPAIIIALVAAALIGGVIGAVALGPWARDQVRDDVPAGSNPVATAVVTPAAQASAPARPAGAAAAPTASGITAPPQTPRPTPAGSPGAGQPGGTTGRPSRGAGLSLEQKVGQMFMVGFEGTRAQGAIVDLIERRYVGNAVYLGDNVSTPEQLRALSGQLQSLARKANGGQGMIISTDQEGGLVQRLRAPAFAGLPSARQMAASGDPMVVTGYAQANAKDMRAAGITMDLAPVLDVNDNPANPVIGNRAFGTDPETVIRYGIPFMTGLMDSNIAAVAKHFPGHGNTSQDSHLTLPYVDKSDAALRAVELPPFIAAIERGVDAVMVAHVVYRAWDPDRPASLSPRIITGLLREELGFQGVVMTDDMNMAAITDNYGPGPAAVLAVEAGVDILLIAGPLATQQAMIDAVTAAVRDGRLSEERINQSVERILALKAKYGMG